MSHLGWSVPAGDEGGNTLRLVLIALLAGCVLGIAVALVAPLFALIGLVGLIAVAAIFMIPEMGVLGFIAVANLLPFAVIPVRLGLSLTLVDAVLTCALLAWLYWAIQRNRPLLGSAASLPVLVFIGLSLVSLVLGLTYSISPERFRLFIKGINSIVLFFTVLNSIRDLPSLRRMVTAVLLCGATAAAIAIVLQYLPEATTVQILSALGPLGYPTGAAVLRPIADTNIMRAIGTSVDPNVLGGLLMMVAALLFGQLVSPGRLLPRKLLLPVTAIVLLALVLTNSRSAFGGAVVGAIVVGTFKDRRVLLLVALGLVVFPLLPRDWVFVNRIWSGLAFEDRGAAMRLDEYTDAINLITMYPWFGIGFGEPPSIDLYLGVSSMYLLIGQEMGLLGMGAFLVILAVLAVQIVSALKTVVDEQVRGMLLGLGAALAAACAAGLLDHYFVNIVFPHMIAVFWLYAGLASVAGRLARCETKDEAPGCA